MTDLTQYRTFEALYDALIVQPHQDHDVRIAALEAAVVELFRQLQELREESTHG